MQVYRRALYNSLRMNWLLDPNLAVEPWQVEDYRSMPLPKIFERLRLQDIVLDRASFLSLAEDFDAPEDLTESLLEGINADPVTQDQVYLFIFELWRRLLPEKASLSIFCDELDYQIQQYDSGQLENLETLEDALSQLKTILDENSDQGADPMDVFESICSGCANDIESFLYDFISEQIDQGNEIYASELLDIFADYVRDVRWFDFLRARLFTHSDPEAADLLIQQIIKDSQTDPELELYLEILLYMVQAGNRNDFASLVKKTVPLLDSEEDFQDLLNICADFYHRLDQENIEMAIQRILKKRSRIPFESRFDKKDPDAAELFKVIE